MNISRRRFVSISAGMALAAKTGIATAASRPVIWRGVVLGADAKLVIAGLPQNEARRLVSHALGEAERLESIFSLYRTDSALSKLNRDGHLKAPPADMLALLSTVEGIYNASGGLFDPTIQPLWHAYARHRGDVPVADFGKARALVGWNGVKTSSKAVELDRPGMALSLNGIAQGYITDRIAALFQREGLKDAVVKMGEIQAMGSDDRGQPWQIALSGSSSDMDAAKVHLNNQAVATSSATGTTFDGAASHILHPRTGLPAKSRWLQVSVTHRSATVADGLSTAAVLMDESDLDHLAARFNGVEIIAVSADGRPVTYSS